MARDKLQQWQIETLKYNLLKDSETKMRARAHTHT